MKLIFRAAMAVLAFAGAHALAQAPQPSGAPLRLIVPFTPGTGIDIVARTVGPRLGQRLGRTVVVENRAGASGNIGTEAVVRAPADGNTLLVSVNTLVMNKGLYPQLPFDPVKDLVPVSLTSWGQLILVAPPTTGFKTAGDLVSAAKARPGRLNYASPGVGTPHHMSMELFKQTAGVYLTHIPYRGTAQAVTDLLGGQVDAMFLPIHVVLPHVKTGKQVALAIGSDKRHPLLPELPTLEQARAGKVNVDMWFGIFAPPGTPADQVARLNQELRDILASPEVRTAFQSQGMDPASSSPEEFRPLVANDADRCAALIRAAKIKAE
jgi:tripartite-type tricarboxylate transporter receptor subunit TctC